MSHELVRVSGKLLEKTLQLADQKKKLSTIIDSMCEGLLSCNSQGNIIHYNEPARILLNLPAGNLTNRCFYDLCTEVPGALGLHPHCSAQPDKKIVDISCNRKELRISLSPVLDEDQNTTGFVLIIQDRSEQAELDRMKSDIISIVSHELRSPLTSIKGYIDLMVAGDLGEIPDQITEYLRVISANANRLAALIDDMLDLSRIESGKLNMSFERVDVKYLCDYVYLTMKPNAEKKEIALQMDIAPGLTISGDMERLQQALTNLLSNAIKYTPHQGSVSIRAEKREQEVHISVSDNGIGISAENQQKLFQKFFRVKNEKTRGIGGTGLGLCIAKTIVEAHEGRITFQSAEEAGSTFTMNLPLYQP